ncbi:MAG TPA: DEAD/DEAH box helicase [Thermoanaerobaculia bacterium]
MSFDSFQIDPALLAGVRDLGFEQPTDIQQDAIPWGLEGRDVLACAMTGSGKTAAFGLPILERLLAGPRGKTRALILSPTRELASQIEDHLRQLGAHTHVRVASIYGGVAYEPQEKAFREGYEILVATPGRLLDHLRRPYARLDDLEVLVLDEADRMLDMGFIPDVRRILAQVPKDRQTLFFSATLPAPIVRLAGDMLRDPVTINLERKSAPAEGVRQAAYPVRHELKPALLLHLLTKHKPESALVFCRTRERADLVGEYLRRAGEKVAVIHGSRTQQHRTKAMDAFKAGRYRVLVATDVAARGIDIEELDVVVNLDVPSSPDDYIHRVGRTARAGATGDAWTFVAARELADLHLIEKSNGKKLERIRLEDFDYAPNAATVAALTRPPAKVEVPVLDEVEEEEAAAEESAAVAEEGAEEVVVAEEEMAAAGAGARGGAAARGIGGRRAMAAARRGRGEEPAEEATAGSVGVERAEVPATEVPPPRGRKAAVAADEPRQEAGGIAGDEEAPEATGGAAGGEGAGEARPARLPRQVRGAGESAEAAAEGPAAEAVVVEAAAAETAAGGAEEAAAQEPAKPERKRPAKRPAAKQPTPPAGGARRPWFLAPIEEDELAEDESDLYLEPEEDEDEDEEEPAAAEPARREPAVAAAR